MAVRLLFFWSSVSLLFWVMLLKVSLLAVAAWALLTVFCTKALAWIRGESLLRPSSPFHTHVL